MDEAMYWAKGSRNSHWELSLMVQFTFLFMLEHLCGWDYRSYYLLMLDNICPNYLLDSCSFLECEKSRESLLEPGLLVSCLQSWKVSNQLKLVYYLILSCLGKAVEKCFIIQRLGARARMINKQIEVGKEKMKEEMEIGTNFIREIITKDFINSLKIQISQKVKPSKSILEALKHSNIINQSQKKTIDELNAKIQVLQNENKTLKEKIGQLQQTIKEKDEISNSLLYSASLTRRQSERNEQLKNKESIQAENDKNIEIQFLKEKIRHLQQYKALKQVRFTEIIERQAQYVGQIDLLKYKNQALSSTIKNLQQSLLKSKQERSTLQQRITRKKSEASQKKFRSYINQEDSFKSDESIHQIKQIKNLVVRRENPSLLQSCTRAVDIEQTYNIDSVQNVKKESQSFNEIDLILGEDVQNFKTNSNINSSERQIRENVNSSIIAININAL